MPAVIQWARSLVLCATLDASQPRRPFAFHSSDINALREAALELCRTQADNVSFHHIAKNATANSADAVLLHTASDVRVSFPQWTASQLGAIVAAPLARLGADRLRIALSLPPSLPLALFYGRLNNNEDWQTSLAAASRLQLKAYCLFTDDATHVSRHYTRMTGARVDESSRLRFALRRNGVDEALDDGVALTADRIVSWVLQRTSVSAGGVSAASPGTGPPISSLHSTLVANLGRDVARLNALLATPNVVVVALFITE